MTRAGLFRLATAFALAVAVAMVATDGAPALPLATRSADSGRAAGSQFTLKFVINPAPVPRFSVHSLSGQTLDPGMWRGKVVILNFWATWCGPCRYEIPELEQLQKQFPKTLQVVGLSVDEAPAADVKSFVDRIGVNYPVGIASDQLQERFGGILALPTSFVLDRAGRVVQKHVGLIPADYYREEVSYLAGMPVEAKVETFADQGQVFPANVKFATQLPGIDMTRLSLAQRKAALRLMNEKRCTCGCAYTLAQCRILDSACPVSQKAAQAIADSARRGTPAAKPAAALGKPAARQ
ncbi:MAG TPA: TlpA disulfide reductase family protein [Candidatus Acidoferrales bacterium]|nr:TlpA disulfide reductase family protein [Candidatus Acidoferrales bacterium]